MRAQARPSRPLWHLDIWHAPLPDRWYDIVRLCEQASVKYDVLGSTNQNKQTVKVLKVMV